MAIKTQQTAGCCFSKKKEAGKAMFIVVYAARLNPLITFSLGARSRGLHGAASETLLVGRVVLPILVI